MRIDVGLVTGNYFSVMGLSPDPRSRFDPSDDGTGAAPVMMLTHEYWKKRFGGDPRDRRQDAARRRQGGDRRRRAAAGAVLPGDASTRS